jgi:hypothetical protein
MKILKHKGKILRHKHKIIKHHLHGGNIHHLIHKHHLGGNISELKRELKHLIIGKKKPNRIKF